ncbi:hypothetical protein ACFO3I_04295 [Rheinheimera marina]|uniref:Uncharacterized protein n=1 Tax=Rheinheimera marina TaxID=1774958 RepID=A0ABV9JJS1_9GAMM
MKANQMLMVLTLALCTKLAWADGRVVDKVYHPYVNALEREFEYRYFYQRQSDHPNNNAMGQKLGYGFSVSDRMALELYLNAERIHPDDYRLSGYEAELRWMLTEQGQYSADWALLFELERQNNDDNYELTTGVLVEKEFGPTSLTVNALLVYEWGQTLKDEIESEFRAQYRYRYLPALQPSIELYSGEKYKGAGPGFMGVHKFSTMQQLKWEAAVVFAIDNQTVDKTIRFALEFEF